MPPPVTRTSSRGLWVGMALVLVTIAAFWPILGNGFTNYDDDQYVIDNPSVREGLTVEGLRWAMTATDYANWHPLTWISHMADCELWGLDPRGHHLTSLLLHAVNAVLLFLLLHRMTRAIWPSAAVAALFALHPLHVESVAWVAERKDVLSTLFGFLTILAYVRYVEAPGPARYAVLAGAFVLGLAAKPMLVTLPFVLLLLDYWPLGRLPGQRSGRRFGPMWEKVPLVALAAASSAITLFAQSEGKALGDTEEYPWPARLGNAIVSCAEYVRKAVWPADLAVFYPHPGNALPGWKMGAAAIFLAVVSALALRERRRRPYLLVGWLWYLGTLVPVLGLVQVGEQALADRYTYIPLIGLFVIVAWGVAELLASYAPGRAARASVAAGVAAVLLGLGAASFYQARKWRDSFSLFEHALAVTRDNYVAHINLGLALSANGDATRAAEHFAHAVALKPNSSIGHNNLGAMLGRLGNWREAAEHYRAALEIDPEYDQAHENLATALFALQSFEEAAAHLSWVANLRPDDATVRYDWGTSLAYARRFDEAIAQFREALRLRPDYPEAHYNLGLALLYQGDAEEAWKEVLEAQRQGYDLPPGILSKIEQARASAKSPPGAPG